MELPDSPSSFTMAGTLTSLLAVPLAHQTFSQMDALLLLPKKCLLQMCTWFPPSFLPGLLSNVSSLERHIWVLYHKQDPSGMGYITLSLILLCLTFILCIYCLFPSTLTLWKAGLCFISCSISSQHLEQGLAYGKRGKNIQRKKNTHLLI